MDRRFPGDGVERQTTVAAPRSVATPLRTTCPPSSRSRPSSRARARVVADACGGLEVDKGFSELRQDRGRRRDAHRRAEDIDNEGAHLVAVVTPPPSSRGGQAGPDQETFVRGQRHVDAAPLVEGVLGLATGRRPQSLPLRRIHREALDRRRQGDRISHRDQQSRGAIVHHLAATPDVGGHHRTPMAAAPSASVGSPRDATRSTRMSMPA